MDTPLFNKEDLSQIESRGMRPEEVASQIDLFKKGFPYARLRRPCTLGDGILVLDPSEIETLEKNHSEAAMEGRMMKFVPASGAASRMFKLLLRLNNRYSRIEKASVVAEAEKGDPDHKIFLRFIEKLDHFAFYDDLRKMMSRDGLDVQAVAEKGDLKPILEYVLTPGGLALADLPKGLVKFHRYPSRSRTAFEEHLLEAAGYVRDRSGIARIHFTLSPEHEFAVKEHVKKACALFEKPDLRFEVTYSAQEASTDTLAVDMENRPFRDESGRLLFRPGGHGALLKNIKDLGGDIVFIKNIDNVVPDRLKEQTNVYKRALGGLLTAMQGKIFSALEKLGNRDVSEADLREIEEFAKENLALNLPGQLKGASKEEKIRFFMSSLHRPLRVCGMVRNAGEPGGGPFWVEQADGTLSPQIIESSQVDLEAPDQREIWEASTHFNPVDLVCGVRDYLGRPFDLLKFRDPDTGFISIKSKQGRNLKALELPGLWNGSMARWNTIFVEVPGMTFNPVKTVFDLLRKAHHPAPGISIENR